MSAYKEKTKAITISNLHKKNKINPFLLDFWIKMLYVCRTNKEFNNRSIKQQPSFRING